MALDTKEKSRVSIDIFLQIGLTLFTMYIANRVSIDIWRSMTGH
jgi:hypothetical protein